MEERRDPRENDKRHVHEKMIQSQRIHKNSSKNNYDDSSKNKGKGTFLKPEQQNQTYGGGKTFLSKKTDQKTFF